MHDAARSVERVFREEGPKVLATLIRQLRDFELAEEVLQEALAAALEHWRTELPREPAAWILTTARRRALDRLRRARLGREKGEELDRLREVEAELERSEADGVVIDDGLRLVFICCHPALSMDARVALTLRSVGGLTTAEIARAYLVPEATMAQRLVRAKAKIKLAGIPYRVPEAEELAERRHGVLAVIYLIFNEGYFPGRGDEPIRIDLCREAIRLGHRVAALLPEPQVFGLVALMTLLHARRHARVDDEGAMIALEDQDRERWMMDEIRAGVAVLEEALALGRVCPYQLQAAIAAVHAEAKTAAETDWPQIVMLYRELDRRFPSPIVSLNLAVALSHLRGPEDALARIDGLSGLSEYQPYHAARADLLRQLGRFGEAGAAYERAIALTDNRVVERFLRARRETVAGG